MDNFNSEFHYRVKKAKGNRNGNDKSKNQSYNAKGRNNYGNNKGRNNNNNNNGDKPLWNAKGKPLCWNCGKYGHLSKDCRKPRKDGQDNRNQNGQRNNGRNGNGNRSNNNGSNGNSNNANSQQRQSEAHFIPDGLKDLYNLPSKRHQAGYAAAVDQSDMAEIMQLFDRAMEEQQNASLQGMQAPEGAVAPEGVASGGSTPEGVSTPCSSSSQHPEDTGSTGSTGTSKKLLGCAPSPDTPVI
ncbi:hypothetical protein DL771_004343 [Monosporascus sp. 5C6A]|nr:hypothetical protein DL771_004343 [Monosporascus sp. 5C6A]